MSKLTLTDIAGGYGLVATYNANNDLIEAALENTLSLDGTTPNAMGANLDMNSNRVVNVSDPSGNQDAATKAYVDTSITNLYSGQVDFSTGGNYTITGAWTFSGNQNFSGSVVITDGSGDDMTIRNLGGAGSFIMDYDGSSGGDLNLRNWDTVRVGSGAQLLLRGPGDLATSEIYHDGTDLIISSTSGDNVRFDTTVGTVEVDANLFVEDGHQLRVYDGAEDDFIYLQHANTYAVVGTGGTGTGAVDILLDAGSQDVLIGQGSQGSLKIKEGAAATGDTAGYGQLWVKDNTPSDLYYTDDTGQDIQITRNGVLDSKRSAVKTADESITSDATVSTDSDLSGISIPTEDKWYSVEALLHVGQVTADPDFKFNFIFSETPQENRMSTIVTDSTVTTTLGYNGAMITAQAVPCSALSQMKLHVQGYFKANAVAPGTLGLQWAQNTSNANATTLQAGSWIKIERLD